MSSFSSWLRAILLVFLCIAAWTVTAAHARVVISEVMWAGSDLSTADEWIELARLDSGSGSLDISGWNLTTRNGKGEEVSILQFSSGTTVSSGEYLLIGNYDAANSRLAVNPDIVTTAVSLPNTKLLLRLYDASGSLIDVVDDGIGVPFAGFNASGTGARASMERIDLSASGSVKGNWQSAIVSVGFDSGSLLLGTPGSRNVPAGSSSASSSFSSSSAGSQSSSSGSGIVLPAIRITEVLSNPKGRDDHEWIEIANFGSGSMNIAGWKLDEGNSPGHFVIPDQRTMTGAFPAKAESGFVLLSGEHVSFRKSISGLPLSNAGEFVSLMSGDLVIDRWEYPETAEEVSYGRSSDDPDQFQVFCVPSEGKKNFSTQLDVMIGIQTSGVVRTQSGGVTGTGKLSLNLEARVATGSLASASCSWDYGDGFLSDRCNPPSHSFASPGTYQIQLSVQTHCGNTVKRSLPVFVAEKPKTKKSSGSSGGTSISPQQPKCTPSVTAGVHVSELLPNPYGEEKEGEWIELKNQTDHTVSLCGWSLDDSEGGSKPFKLDDYTISPDEYLVLPRTETKLALNNDRDSVRLFAPNGEAGVLVEQVSYEKSIEGESYALRSDGHFVWTYFQTPKEENQFRTAERRHPHDNIIVSAALPNPVGKDSEGEWIEVTNVSDETLTLVGWSLDNRIGSSAPFALDDAILQPGETRRFGIKETSISLANAKDVVRILDPDGYTASVFGWEDAEQGKIYRLPRLVSDRIHADVVRVVDGDTIDISFSDPDELDRIPPSVKRRWEVVSTKNKPSLRVRLIGIDTPETVHPEKAIERFGVEASNFVKALLEGKNVTLEFDADVWDKYERLLAYVYIDGTSVQSQLLQHGLAYAYVRFPFVRKDEFIAYEQEARFARLGIWGDDDVKQKILEQQEEVEEEIILEEEGLILSVDPPSGRVASGTKIRFTTSVPSELFVSINSGALQPFSGSYIVQEDTELFVSAERKSASGNILRTSLSAHYVLVRDRYDLNITISEIYPSPDKGEEEWIEIQNLSDESVPLAGWTLDDLQDGGSKPWTIPGDISVPPSGYVLLAKGQTGLNFNNDGDDVWLVAPDESVAMTVSYGKVKKGRSVVIDQEKVSVMVSKPALSEVEVTNHDTVPSFDEIRMTPKEDEAIRVIRESQSILIPSVHPRRQRKMAEDLQLGIFAMGGFGPERVRHSGLGSEGMETEPEPYPEPEIPMKITTATDPCLTSVPTPGLPNLCIAEVTKKSKSAALKNVKEKTAKSKKSQSRKMASRKLKMKFLPRGFLEQESDEEVSIPEALEKLKSLVFDQQNSDQQISKSSAMRASEALLVALTIASAFALAMVGYKSDAQN